MKLWDYSDLFGNVKGWIAPEISLFWGVSILILVKFVQPTVMAIINHLNGWIALVIVSIMAADLIWTVMDTVKFQQAAERLKNMFARNRKDCFDLLKQNLTTGLNRKRSFQ